MKVKAGQTVYFGGKKLQAGDEIPEAISKRIEKQQPKPPKPPKPPGSKPTDKP